MSGDLLALFGFNHDGTVALITVTLASFAAALLVNLIPMSTGIRAALITLGIVAASIFVSTRPYGEDRGLWAIIVGCGVLAWFLGFALAGIVRAAWRGRQT